MSGTQSDNCGQVQQGLEDPFKGRTAAARVARDGYLHMWDVLVREAAASELLFDSHLLEKLTNLVIALNWCACAVSGVASHCPQHTQRLVLGTHHAGPCRQTWCLLTLSCPIDCCKPAYRQGERSDAYRCSLNCGPWVLRACMRG